MAKEMNKTGEWARTASNRFYKFSKRLYFVIPVCYFCVREKKQMKKIKNEHHIKHAEASGKQGIIAKRED